MFIKFMENKGFTWNDFDYCYEMEDLIEEYADIKLQEKESNFDNPLLSENIPIEEWGEETVLKEILETHRDYGEDILRRSLISFRQYLRDNFR